MGSPHARSVRAPSQGLLRLNSAVIPRCCGPVIDSKPALRSDALVAFLIRRAADSIARHSQNVSVRPLSSRVPTSAPSPARCRPLTRVTRQAAATRAAGQYAQGVRLAVVEITGDRLQMRDAELLDARVERRPLDPQQRRCGAARTSDDAVGRFERLAVSSRAGSLRAPSAAWRRWTPPSAERPRPRVARHRALLSRIQFGSTENTSDSDTISERSITFWSSRTLPGHACASKRSRVAGRCAGRLPDPPRGARRSARPAAGR